MQHLIINESRHAVPRKFLASWLTGLSKELRARKVLSASKASLELTLVFLDKRSAQRVNRDFRKKDYATDVLSFSAMEPDSIGELILCPEVLKKQAKEHKLRYQEELGYMVLHGVLHLLGYEHEKSKKEAQEMFELQDSIFAKLLKNR